MGDVYAGARKQDRADTAMTRPDDHNRESGAASPEPSNGPRLPTFDDVVAAHERIARAAHVTPALESAFLNERVNTRVFLKAETLQRTGSFKFRGAHNRISQISSGDVPGGIVACSSGNHAQGVAEAARLAGMPATIVMPRDAPDVKIARTRRAGAEVVLYDRDSGDRDEIACQLCLERDALFVPPFDHPDIIAGQGTAGLELCEQAQAAGACLSAVLVPISGGGLAAGVALAVKHSLPDCDVHGVEPDAFDDYARSLRSGQRERNPRKSGSICDALLVAEPGVLTFALAQRLLSDGLSVSDMEVREAMRFAFDELKLVVEPGGAVALAALLSGRFRPEGAGAVGVILSGGNVDPQWFCQLIS